MKRTTLILFYALFLTFNSCTHKVSKENITKDLSCNTVDLTLPLKYNKAYTGNISVFFINATWYKKSAQNITTIPISENTDIDSVIVILQGYNRALLKDSLDVDKWSIVSLKVPQYPLNIITKLMCKLSLTEERWRYKFTGDDEITFFLFNKNTPRRIPNESEKKDYLETLEDDESWTLEYGGRYSFITSYNENIIRYLSESDTVVRFDWNDNIPSELKIEKLENFIVDFKNNYEDSINDFIETECKRNTIKIEIVDNIPLKDILEIISLSRKYKLSSQVDCVNNYIVICTKCNDYEI